MTSNDRYDAVEETPSEFAPTFVIPIIFVLAVAAGIGIAVFEESSSTAHHIDARVLVEASWKLGEARECRTYSDDPTELTCDVGTQSQLQKASVILRGSIYRSDQIYVRWLCTRREVSFECRRSDDELHTRSPASEIKSRFVEGK